jgi:uncharacterized protein YjbI with pentapeptide repeats
MEGASQMGMTLQTLAAQLTEAQLDKRKGAELLLRGMQLPIDYADSPWEVLVSLVCPPQNVVSALLENISTFVGPPSVDTCLAIAVQHAYLRALQITLHQSSGVLESYFDLDDVVCEESWLNRLAVYREQITTFPIQAGQFDFRNFHNMPFVKEYLERFTEIWLKMRIFRQSQNAFDAQNLARRISYQIYPRIIHNLAADDEFYAPLIEHLHYLGFWDSTEVAQYKAHLLALPAKPIFHETFALRDMYIELQTTHVVQVPQPSRYGTSEAWDGTSFEKGSHGQLTQTVLDQLDDREHVVFIQAGPGMGKSTFCSMLAAKIALGYPEWIPILIRLRDERFHPELPLEDIVQEYIQPYFHLSDELLQTRRILLLFDGFDELRLPPESGPVLRRFFQALSDFQRRCARDNHCRHKIVITGRPVKIQDLESNLPSNFLRLTIESLENPQVIAWLGNWEKMTGGKAATAFRTYLERGNAFNESETPGPPALKHFVSNPLLLFLLGELHKHQILDSGEPSHLSSPVGIYERILDWGCGEYGGIALPTREQHTLATHGVSPDILRRVLQEIATCIWHEHRTVIPLAHLQTYLSSTAPRSIKKLTHSGLRGIHNIVISLPFDTLASETQTAGFSHKSFGEYLTAEKIVLSLQKISESFAEEIDLESTALQEAAHRFYSVFGVTLLTDEIWEFVMDILVSHSTPDDLVKMTERLYRLYITYSNGRWMNEDISRTQWGVLKRYDMPLSLLQFEAQAGINLFVLLCLFYWKTAGTFDICGREPEGTFDANRFRKLMAFSELVGTFGLFRRISHLLRRVNLQRANLLCANLRRVDLQEADVRAAVLRDANLRGANLQEACLEGADLRVASFQNANLAGANLKKTNAEDVNLRDANLFGADLSHANLLCAEMRDAELTNATLHEAVLYGAMLQGANFDGADLTGAIISKQQLARDIDLFTEEQVAQFHVVHD